MTGNYDEVKLLTQNSINTIGKKTVYFYPDDVVKITKKIPV